MDSDRHSGSGKVVILKLGSLFEESANGIKRPWKRQAPWKSLASWLGKVTIKQQTQWKRLELNGQELIRSIIGT